MTEVEITELGRETLWAMQSKARELNNEATTTSYLRALETILTGGYGKRVKVYRDGDLGLELIWDSGFVMGIVWRSEQNVWSQHS